jgi:hypothetical protein
MAHCKHLVEQRDCADCRSWPAVSPPAVLPADYGPWIAAAYYGECAGCGDDIEPGCQIRADGEGGWLCEDCGSARPEHVIRDARLTGEVVLDPRQPGYRNLPASTLAGFLDQENRREGS